MTYFTAKQILSAETAALKSGLGPFYGRLLDALERIADALELSNQADNAKARVSARKSDA